jgi:hypothetical protein
MRRLMKFHLLTTFALFLCTGCLVVPVPHQRLHAYGIRGRVVDENGHPLATATVADDTTSNGVLKANSDGRFSLRPVRGWHGGYFIGVISFSVWPDLDMIGPIRTVQVEAPGYVTQRLEVKGTDRVTNELKIEAGTCSALVEGEYLNLGTVMLFAQTAPEK